MEAHHERKKEAYVSNPDIDKAKSSDNYHLIKPEFTYYKEIENRLEAGGCKVRSNSVKLVDTLITTKKEFFDFFSDKDYFERALEFISERVGKENIVSAVVHLDEKTPHMHLCFVPLTEDKRLSAKEILGNKAKMSKWQDDFYAHMKEVYDCFERGKPAKETNRKHIPVRLFKDATQLNNQLEKIEKALEDINMLNASKKRDAAVEMLNEWFPKASSFISEVNRLKDNIDYFQEKENELREENAGLKMEKNTQRQEFRKELRAKNDYTEKLYESYKSYVDFVNFIPKDLRNKLNKAYLEQQQQIKLEEQEYDMEYEWEG